ncbi:phytolongin Phyl1.2-like [Musa acuminata AAA Group]|uniref:phytolongin Phyl1.2-like n=1 Tax=Musa acuminata AAA Group TaxID=214697 RepID=UPI0031CFA10B
MIPVPDPNPIFYACVAHGTAILAELSTADLPPDLAAQCLAAPPRFHRHYSHTTGGRIYAFLMIDPLVFFAISDEAILGKPHTLLFLRRLRDAFSSSTALRRRATAVGGDGSDSLPHLCLQEEFLPELRGLVHSAPSLDEEPPPPASSPQPSEFDEDHKAREKKCGKGKRKMVISAGNRDIVDSDPGNGGSRMVHKVWRQHVRAIILIDLVVCCLLLGVWVSICKGFECITN